MTGYSGRPLWQKLGCRAGMVVFVDRAPANYLSLLALPPQVAVSWTNRIGPTVDLVHVFVQSNRELKNKLPVFRKTITAGGAIWVSWPKKTSGMTTDLTEHTVRSAALPLGLVDVKVCAVDEVWSGLKLVIRKELR